MNANVITRWDIEASINSELEDTQQMIGAIRRVRRYLSQANDAVLSILDTDESDTVAKLIPVYINNLLIAEVNNPQAAALLAFITAQQLSMDNPELSVTDVQLELDTDSIEDDYISDIDTDTDTTAQMLADARLDDTDADVNDNDEWEDDTDMEDEDEEDEEDDYDTDEDDSESWLDAADTGSTGDDSDEVDTTLLPEAIVSPTGDYTHAPAHAHAHATSM